MTVVEPLSKKEKGKDGKDGKGQAERGAEAREELLRELEKKEKHAEAEDTVGRAIGCLKVQSRDNRLKGADAVDPFPVLSRTQLTSAIGQEPQMSPRSSLCASGSLTRRNLFQRMPRAQFVKSSSTVLARWQKSPPPRFGCWDARTVQTRADFEVSSV